MRSVGNIKRTTEVYASFSHLLSTAQGGLFIVSGHFKFHNGPFVVWLLEFLQLSLFHGYKYVLVLVWIYSY